MPRKGPPRSTGVVILHVLNGPLVWSTADRRLNGTGINRTKRATVFPSIGAARHALADTLAEYVRRGWATNAEATATVKDYTFVYLHPAR